MAATEPQSKAPRRLRFLGRGAGTNGEEKRSRPSKWSMGILNDSETVEVPGSVLLLAAHRNEPLGLRNVHARTSHSSIPAGFPVNVPHARRDSNPVGSAHPAASQSGSETPHAPLHNDVPEKKTTNDGTIILEPQPDDSANDPLNWPNWRRDLALGSLGLYCMIGGGITPIIAAGFTDVAEDFDIHTETVALTTGLYMMGLGVGSVLVSPTAILYGKRPVYLVSGFVFIGTSLWAAWSPSFESLLAARVFQGIAVSPVECLPSATIAEIFFLHERAYRIGIYTLLLLGGKNLVPLVSAAIIGRWGWRWVFWITAMVVALGSVLLFFFVPETFWDRTPTRKPSKRPSFLRRLSSQARGQTPKNSIPAEKPVSDEDNVEANDLPSPAGHKEMHVGFAADATPTDSTMLESSTPEFQPSQGRAADTEGHEPQVPQLAHGGIRSLDDSPGTSAMANAHASSPAEDMRNAHASNNGSVANIDPYSQGPAVENEKAASSRPGTPGQAHPYTHHLRQQPAKSFVQQLKPYHGRLNNDKWLKVMVRPFVLFAYPAVLWSSIVYACSVGWLIVISETMAIIYRDPTLYNFTALQTGLVYISPFIGGILGTGVAGKLSDVIVKYMAARNGGLYEPEFRLVMGIPILITTCIGLMGFGWSAEERDHWIVPTLFFGIMSFGCSLGSTTAITFCVDSYRQYAGEALVTLNFSKNIFHGLVFSLFVTHWMADDGARAVFIWIGIIQLIMMLTTIPMYIYGKRARMWTVRRNLMERL
ncbi:hypothetical protein S7711_09221 [Stachybotrys chartarum IBT 7711]|uniref:Major facilitator superfamily (MFS) profile domain-containing protein n=1 Tax=Stachybotrys chartarum (strain CBS 109288 / IBT 7711) TaxID=1280523 RepID=A0A084ALM9_STACB|nr:hypothetical protein S7711_09221 [Stachybotrys chartarum IBT 7711]KFA46971.1 hypothetical protein S40293_10034 [Stachybotrys chartarum IBT 40293]